MTFLTIFTAPKPFTAPHIRTIQCNAIQSWCHLGGGVDIILIGQEDGMTEVAAEFGVRHWPEVIHNEWGTPLVSSIFGLARKASDSPLLAYVNADILLMPDFVEAAMNVIDQANSFLIVGQRWDLDVRDGLSFPPNWDQILQERTHQEGQLHSPAGSDYFIFPRQQFADIPDFSIGRAGWDNWMIYHARKQGWMVIDATPDLMVVHQNHDYNHLPESDSHYDQEESLHNVALARRTENAYTDYILLDADKELRDGLLRTPRPSLIRMIRRAETLLTPREQLGPRWTMTIRLRRWRRKWSKTAD